MSKIHLYAGEYARDVLPYCHHGRFGAGLVGHHHTSADPRDVTCGLCRARLSGAAHRAVAGDSNATDALNRQPGEKFSDYQRRIWQAVNTQAKPQGDGDPRPLGDDAA